MTPIPSLSLLPHNPSPVPISVFVVFPFSSYFFSLFAPQLLCTGQTPNTSLLRALDSRVVDPASGLARVGRGMQLAITFSSLRGFSSPPFNMCGTNPDVEGATTAHGRGPASAGKEGEATLAREKERAEEGRSTGQEEEEEEQCAPLYTLPTRTEEGGDGRRIEEAIEDAQDDASLLAAALAEIELWDAASGSSSSPSSDGLEAESLALDDASPSLLVLDSSSDASPSRSLAHSSSPHPTPWSTNSINRQRLQTQGTPILTPETHEAPSLDDAEDEAQTAPYPHIFAIGDAADAFGALPAGHNAASPPAIHRYTDPAPMRCLSHSRGEWQVIHEVRNVRKWDVQARRESARDELSRGRRSRALGMPTNSRAIVISRPLMCFAWRRPPRPLDRRGAAEVHGRAIRRIRARDKRRSRFGGMSELELGRGEDDELLAQEAVVL
ncbi:hypothetical protein B0H13DRAFT_2681161 [Mycena leptocephala]|nr:hypothetical protein B0H13DRAFT_2681161 [Mycena leptocephala]